MNETAIVLNRPKEWIAILRKYRIVVDGDPIARLGRGQTAIVPTPPGRHTIEARTDWLSSHALEVNLVEGQHLVIECRADSNPLAVWSYTLRRRRGYLRLKVLSS